MLPHQQRVVDELKELTDKYNKLSAFFEGPIFLTLTEQEQRRLNRQHTYMGLYIVVLTERIEAF